MKSETSKRIKAIPNEMYLFTLSVLLTINSISTRNILSTKESNHDFNEIDTLFLTKSDKTMDDHEINEIDHQQKPVIHINDVNTIETIEEANQIQVLLNNGRLDFIDIGKVDVTKTYQNVRRQIKREMKKQKIPIPSKNIMNALKIDVFLKLKELELKKNTRPTNLPLEVKLSAQALCQSKDKNTFYSSICINGKCIVIKFKATVTECHSLT